MSMNGNVLTLFTLIDPSLMYWAMVFLVMIIVLGADLMYNDQSLALSVAGVSRLYRTLSCSVQKHGFGVVQMI